MYGFISLSSTSTLAITRELGLTRAVTMARVEEYLEERDRARETRRISR
jgi:hypothetical protein